MNAKWWAGKVQKDLIMWRGCAYDALSKVMDAARKLSVGSVLYTEHGSIIGLAEIRSVSVIVITERVFKKAGKWAQMSCNLLFSFVSQMVNN